MTRCNRRSFQGKTALLAWACALALGAAPMPAASAPLGATGEIDLQPLFAARFKDFERKQQPLAQYKGKPMLVYFWEINVIGIAVDNTDKVREFAVAHQINYTLLLGSNDAIALSRQLGNNVGGLPFAVVLDAKGKVVQTLLGVRWARQRCYAEAPGSRLARPAAAGDWSRARRRAVPGPALPRRRSRFRDPIAPAGVGAVARRDTLNTAVVTLSQMLARMFFQMLARSARWLLPLCLVAGPPLVAAAEEFLPPEQAFRMEARALDERSVEIAFTVADGYYMYREPFAFAAEDAGVKLGAAQIPAGKIKFDETFGKNVETHRGRLSIRVPVEAAPAAFVLTVTSQGCADAGLCYPPQQSHARVQLAGFGGEGRASVLAADALTAGAAAPPAAAPNATQDATQSAPPSATPAASPADDGGIDAALRGGRPWVVVGVFFLAGLLLSFTPCVLPMLPILSSIIVGQSGDAATSRSRGFGLALCYSLGMALVYAALGVAAGLAGEGLAAALQNPWVLGAFALLLSLLALSMFGFYELQLPSALRDRLNARAGRFSGGQWAGVFAMGGLSALIVSPCVAAPLAGALVYISQTRDVLLGGSALFSLAAGMSVPLLLVGASAGALLPRAGAWMESVQRFFGVLLLAVAWWILSPVLPAPLAVAIVGVLMLLAASLCGAFDRLPQAAGTGARLGKAIGVALAVLGGAQLLGASGGASDALQPLSRFVQQASPRATSGDAATSPAATGAPRFQRVQDLSELEAIVGSAGRPVMLDFYADWCVSCKEMDHFTFSDPRVRARLGGALLLQADVTRNSPADRALLKRYGLFGPPGILFFDAQGRELASQRVIGFQNAERFLASLGRAGL